MKKQYKVPNHRKTEHIYRCVGDTAEYIDSLELHAGRTMFVWREGGEERELTYGGFLDAVRSVSLGLRTLASSAGIPADKMRVAVIGETSPYWVESYLAVVASGFTAVPMDKELSPEEIVKFLAAAEIKALVYSGTFDSLADSLAARAGEDGVPSIYVQTGMNAEGGNSFSGEGGIYSGTLSGLISLGESSKLEFAANTNTERCCEILFTSGTTGSSKMVMLSQKNIFSVVTSACQSVDFNAEDVLVSVLPLHHTYELACMLAACNYGCKICINDSLRHVLKSFHDYRPTALVLVPLFVTTMYKKIMSEAKKAKRDKIFPYAAAVTRYLKLAGVDLSDKLFASVRDAFGGRLEKIICGGAELAPEMIAVFEAFGISIYEGYGITECSPLVAVTPYYKRKVGSVGPSVPCCEVRIDGNEIGESGFVTGEIQVRGDNVMIGYADSSQNSEAFTPDNWFRTGDIGYMDRDGYIYITGRAKNVIIPENGKNVYPEELEEYLGQIDEIAEAVVIGRNEAEGVVITAVIFPNYAKYGEITDAELKAEIQKKITQLNKRLPSFKQIHKVEFRKVEFEKTSSKKIKRHLIK